MRTETRLQRLARIASAPVPKRIKVRWDNVILAGVAVVSVAIGAIAFAMMVWEFTK